MNHPLFFGFSNAALGLLLALILPVAATAQPSPPQPEEIARLLPGFTLDSHFPHPTDEIKGTIFWIWTPDSEQIQKNCVDALTAGVLPTYWLEVVVSSARNPEKPLWNTRVRFSGGRLPDFSIPPGTFPPGDYIITANLITPSEESIPFLAEVSYEGKTVQVAPRQYFSVTDRPPVVWPSSVRDAAVLLTHARRIAAPSREIYPEDTARDSFSRTVWDMHRFEKKIFLGSGDWQRNTGPAPIWSLQLDERAHADVAAEYVIYGESVQRFRSFADKLYVPDIDPRDGWERGNVYVASSTGAWTKKRTVPNGIHNFDVCAWNNQLYVTCGTNIGAALYASHDDGNSWTKVAGDEAAMARDYRFHQLCPVGGSLLVMPAGAAPGAWVLDDAGEFAFRPIELFPGIKTLSRLTAKRLEPFAGGALYTVSWDTVLADSRGQRQPRPLFFLPTLAGPAVLIEQFKDAHVMDIVVNGDRCHVLTVNTDGITFIGEIFSTGDLKTWTRAAHFSSEAVPFSMEQLDGVFFVGLGPQSINSTDKDSGVILQLEIASATAGRD